MKAVLSFVGDPVMYRVELADVLVPPPPDWESMWVLALVGAADRKVWVNVVKAYAIEPVEPPAVAA